MSDEPILVCVAVSDPLVMADNATGPCSFCGVLLQFRPHAADMKRSCMPCVNKRIASLPEGETIEVAATRKMIEEAIAFMAGGTKH